MIKKSILPVFGLLFVASFSEAAFLMSSSEYSTTTISTDSSGKFEIIDSCRRSGLNSKLGDTLIKISGTFVNKKVKGYGQAKVATSLKVALKGISAGTDSNKLFDQTVSKCDNTVNILSYFEYQKDNKQAQAFRFNINDEVVSLINIDETAEYSNGSELSMFSKAKSFDLAKEIKKYSDLDLMMEAISKMLFTYNEAIIGGSAGGSTSDSGVGSGSWTGGSNPASEVNVMSGIWGTVKSDLYKNFEKSDFYACKQILDNSAFKHTKCSGILSEKEYNVTRKIFDCIQNVTGTNKYNIFESNYIAIKDSEIKYGCQ